MLGVPCFAEPPELLRRSIRSFLAPEVHVVAIDNGASPDVKSTLEEMRGSISVIHNPVNVYVNPAWNQLAKYFLASEHEILVIANADLIAAPNWASSLLARRDIASGREYWVAKLSTEEEVLQRAPSAEATLTNYVHGALFAMTREAVSIAFPVPSGLLIHCGDDWIYWLLARAGFDQQTLHGMSVWHKGFVSGSSLHEFHSIAESDRKRWDSGLNKMCTGLGKIENRYYVNKTEPSDINEHIPILSTYASRCERVTEFGVGRSTWGLLHGRPRYLRSYDVRNLDMREQNEIAAEAGIDFRFCVDSSTSADIEETDLLFIDTIHNYDQIRRELFLHESKVRKYILMHDTETYGSRNESGDGPGLWPAVREFLDAHGDWKIEKRLHNNNGLTILARSPAIKLLPVQADNWNACAYVCTLPEEGRAQLEILIQLGCKPHHRVLEIGSGALVAGFPIMQYLDAGNYFAIEPNAWLVESSLKLPEVSTVVAAKRPRFGTRLDFRTGTDERFDFIISHSILSHASNDQLTDFFVAAYEQLAKDGVLAASLRFAEGNEFGSPGSTLHGVDFADWQYPGVSWFKKDDAIERARRAGLSASAAPELARILMAGNPRAVHDWITARKTNVCLVSAFFRLRDRVVDEDEQFRRFDELAAGGSPILLFLDERLTDRAPKYPNVRVVPMKLEDLWSFQQAASLDLELPVHRTHEKDTRDFLLLQNAKLDLLEKASTLDGSSYFAWIDFGVMKIVRDRGRFLKKLASLKLSEGVLAPGCWTRGYADDVADERVSWRFCGGFLATDRNSIPSLVAAHRSVLKKKFEQNKLTWEVNVWADMERAGQKFDWYPADHDDTLVPSSEDRR